MRRAELRNALGMLCREVEAGLIGLQPLHTPTRAHPHVQSRSLLLKDADDG